MRFRLWHALVFVLALAIFAVARAPAAYFAPQRPGVFTYDSASGTVWRAAFEGVRIGPYQARTMTWRLSPFDLVQGKARLPLTFSQGTIEGEAMLLANWRNDRRLYVSTLRLEGAPLGAVLAPGETHIRELDVFFDDGNCAAAAGQLESDVLVRAGQALNWPGPPLSGGAVCDGEDALVRLTGTNEAGESVAALMILSGDGAAQWRISVQTDRPETEAALAAAGFARGPEGLGRSEEGRWLPF